jgi:hypothetical protein
MSVAYDLNRFSGYRAANRFFKADCRQEPRHFEHLFFFAVTEYQMVKAVGAEIHRPGRPDPEPFEMGLYDTDNRLIKPV